MSITKRKDGDTEITIFTGGDLEALKENLAKQAFGGAPVPEGHCRSCRQPFSDANVFTPAGWGETQLSKLCEKCWDEMWKEEDADG